MTSDIVDVRKLKTDCDLTESSLQEALCAISYDGINVGELTLIVSGIDSVNAGRLANKFSISRIIVVPEWALKTDSWVLCNDYSAVGTPGA